MTTSVSPWKLGQVSESVQILVQVSVLVPESAQVPESEQAAELVILLLFFGEPKVLALGKASLGQRCLFYSRFQWHTAHRRGTIISCPYKNPYQLLHPVPGYLNYCPGWNILSGLNYQRLSQSASSRTTFQSFNSPEFDCLLPLGIFNARKASSTKLNI